jgi:V-type H+-transporting ATPase subunit a
VYTFGIDPIWGKAENELVYVNSLKMKISVIIAIIHMTFGIIIKAVNSFNFKKKIDFYFEFIPQVIFMVTLFGYMDFLIIFKWLKVWDEKVGTIPSNQWAPSIISTMMNIALALGKTG